MKTKIYITGSSGFIGFHCAKKFLNKGYKVHGFDSMNNYYDINLKKSRLKILRKYKNFSFTKGKLENKKKINKSILDFKPKIIIHLAAQAGVRYSLKNPDTYLQSNIIGTFNVIEIAKKIKIKHLIIGSSSSVYGANKKFPYQEIDKTDHQISFYAATKKILDGEKIDIYNKGKMYRDYTYIDDIVDGIFKLLNKIPKLNKKIKIKNDSLSPVAPFRILNIGNTKKVYLLDFINILEKELKKNAIKNYVSMQKGDVHSTLSDTRLLKNITKYNPNTNYKIGLKKFINWYLNYYKLNKIIIS